MDALKFENNLLKELNYELKSKNALLMEKINTLEEKLAQQPVNASGEDQRSLIEAIKLTISTSLQDYFNKKTLNTYCTKGNKNEETVEQYEQDYNQIEMKKKQKTSKTNNNNHKLNIPNSTQVITKSHVQDAIKSAMQYSKNSEKSLEPVEGRNTNIMGTNSSITNLIAAERKSWLFVGNLRKDTSEQQIEAHLKNMSVNASSCKKLGNRNNDYAASFKIGVDPELTNVVLDSTNWPVNVIVKPFRFSSPQNRRYNNNTRRPNFRRSEWDTRRY